MSIIETEELTKVFGKLTAVDHVSFNVEEKEVFGFLGPNGAGKTTTINMLTTLLRPTEGTAKVVGLDIVKDANKVRNLIGLVPQDLTVDEDLTGMENMWLQARLYHVPKEEAKKRIEEVLGLVELKDAANRKVETYSGGMRKRLELAEGLIHYPKILFLDDKDKELGIPYGSGQPPQSASDVCQQCSISNKPDACLATINSTAQPYFLYI